MMFENTINQQFFTKVHVFGSIRNSREKTRQIPQEMDGLSCPSSPEYYYNHFVASMTRVFAFVVAVLMNMTNYATVYLIIDYTNILILLRQRGNNRKSIKVIQLIDIITNKSNQFISHSTCDRIYVFMSNDHMRVSCSLAGQRHIR